MINLFEYNDNTVLTNGKYKYIPLNRVPSEYLLNIVKNKNKNDLNLYNYVKRNKSKIKNRDIKEVEYKSLICSKIAYIDEKAAGIQLGLINRKEQDHKKPVRFYKCDKCSYFHLTSKELN